MDHLAVMKRWAVAVVVLLAACKANVTPAPVIDLGVEGPWALEQGASVDVEVTAASSEGPIALRVEGLPPGITILALAAQPGTSRWKLALGAEWTADPGRHALELVATSSGAIARASVDLVVNAAAPVEVKLVSPAPELWTRGSVSVVVEVAGRVDRLDVLLDGALWRTLEAPFEAALDTEALPERSHVISARARRGAATFDSDRTATVHVDRTAPAFIKQVPVAGDHNVGVREPRIAAWFSEPIVLPAPPVAQMSPATLELTDVHVGIDGRSVVGTVVGGEPGMQVDVTLEGVVDRAGNPAAPVAWTWAYAFWERIDAGLNPSGQFPMRAELVSNDAGDLFVAWATALASGQAHAVWAAFFDHREWVPMGSGWNYEEFDLTIDASGAPILVRAVDASRWGGTSWSTVGNLGAKLGPSYDLWGIRAGVDHLGAPMVASTHEVLSESALRATRLGTSGWQTILDHRLPSSGSSYDRWPLFAGGPAGATSTFLASYEEDVLEVRWRSWTPITGWTDALAPISGLVPPTQGGSPRAYFSPSGTAVVAGERRVGASLSTVAVLLWSGQGWTDLGPALAATEPSIQGSAIALAWSRTGELHAAWSGKGATDWKVLVSRWDGTSWTRVSEVVATSPKSDYLEVEGIAFSANDVYVLWTSYATADSTTRLNAARYTP